MAIEMYDDRIFVDVYDREVKVPVQREFYDDPESRRSCRCQVNRALVQWCDTCECGFDKRISSEECPICGGRLSRFNVDDASGDVDDHVGLSDVYPEGQDDGYASD